MVISIGCFYLEISNGLFLLDVIRVIGGYSGISV